MRRIEALLFTGGGDASRKSVCSQFLRALCVPELGHAQQVRGVLFKTRKKIEVGVTFRAAPLPSLSSISMPVLRRHPVSQCGPLPPLAFP
jgi:hypothetical protein